MKFIASLIFSVVFLLLLIPTTTLAQVDQEALNNSVNAAPGAVLADINIGDVELVQSGAQVEVTFTVDNYGSEPMANLQYGLEIMKVGSDGGQELVDTVVFSESNTVMPGVSSFKEATYSAVNLAPGNYEVWVLAQTPGGLVVGIAMAGNIASNHIEALEIKSEACRLFVAGFKEEYLLSDGVDVAPSENLVLRCPVINHSSVARTISPNFMTYERSIFGDVVDMSYPKVPAVLIMPGEEMVLEITLPKATRPQAYDVVVTYTSEADDSVSNKAIVHYVLQGQSATVQSATFSKDSYTAGEEMELTILWSESADNFADSRSGGTKKAEDYFVEVVVTDQSGLVCGTANEELNNDMFTMKVPATASCTNPTALVTIKTESGTVLDTESITIVPTGAVVVEETTKAGLPYPSKNMFIVISLFAAIGVVLLLWYARKNHDHVAADAIKSLVFLLVFGAGLFASAPTVEAVSWSLTSTYEDCNVAGGDGGVCETRTGTLVSAVVNTNRADRIYAPGQAIVLSGTVRNHACSNLYYGIGANLLGNQITFFEGRGTGTRNISGTFTAPTTPGNYTINLGICHTNASNCSSASINITVANPAVAGRCQAAHYRCSAGTSANNQNNASNYTWTCNGTSGGRNVSCSENKVNGACGVTRNACAAGNAANGSQNATHYTWGCNSPNGGSSASCSLAIPPSVTLSAAPTLVGPGSASNLTWTTAYANSCTASGGWSGAKAITGGTESVSPAVPTTYALSCTGLGGTANATANVTTPSGTLTATSCTIPLGGTSCSSSVNWSRANFLGAVSVRQNGVQFSTAAAGPAPSRTVTPDDRTFTLVDTGSSFTLTTLAAINCATGSVWAGGSCMQLPIITVISNPDIVRHGDTASVIVTVTSPTNLICVMAGAVRQTFDHTGGAAPATRTYTSEPLQSARLVEVTCTNPDYPAVTGTASARIEVVPTIEEI